MSWFKLDDNSYDHPKIEQAGNEAYGVWCRAGGYCSKHHTDGFIPEAKALALGRKSLWIRLEKAIGFGSSGMVEKVENGWQIHDFLEYNPSAEEIKANADGISQHRVKAGKLGAAKRWAGHSKNGKPDGKVAMLLLDGKNGKRDSKRDGKPMAPSRPDPDPVPTDPNQSDPPLLSPVGGEMAKCVRHRGRVAKDRILLPPDWAPNLEHVALAKSFGINCNQQAEMMRDWARDQNARGADWDSRFRNWLRKAADKSPPMQQRLPGGRIVQRTHDIGEYG